MITLLIHFLFVLQILNSTECYSQSRRITPTDSYQILGNPGIRYFGQCNITFAWLIPPPTSTLDAYGHALACKRLGLKDGQLVENIHLDGVVPVEDIHTVNKEDTASMSDLSRFDALLRADPRAQGSRFAQNVMTQFADEDRYFFLSDRIGDFNIMVLLRPGQPLKIELIDPFSSDHVFTPQHVLCLRKQCADIQPNETSKRAQLTENSKSNNNSALLASLSRTEKHNRELYLQLVISRVACALLSVLTVVFAICALTLCVRLRNPRGYFRRKTHPSELSICRDQHPSPSYFQPNGKLNMGQPSPAYLPEFSQRQLLAGDNTSVTNLLMTGSNLSDCGGMTGFHGTPLTYTTINSPYGQLAAYPVSANCGSMYSENTGLVAYVPVNSRGVMLPCQNGASSPAPSHNSLGEVKSGLVRTGSLGRYSASNSASIENGRKRLLRVYRPNVAPKSNGSTIYQNHIDADGKATTQDQAMDITEASDLMLNKTLENSSRPADLITFQGNQLPVIHRYPSEHFHPYGMINTPRGSLNADGMTNRSNGHENCVNLVRKPALAKS